MKPTPAMLFEDRPVTHPQLRRALADSPASVLSDPVTAPPTGDTDRALPEAPDPADVMSVGRPPVDASNPDPAITRDVAAGVRHSSQTTG